MHKKKEKPNVYPYFTFLLFIFVNKSIMQIQVYFKLLRYVVLCHDKHFFLEYFFSSYIYICIFLFLGMPKKKEFVQFT